MIKPLSAAIGCILLAAAGLAATYSIYLVAAVISVFFVLRYVHETKGKELEQMEG